MPLRKEVPMNPKYYTEFKRRKLREGKCFKCVSGLINKDRSNRLCTDCLEKNKANRQRWWDTLPADRMKVHKKHNSVRALKERNALRDLVVEHYGKVCACCNEAEPMFLELDHIHGGGNAHRKALKKNGGWRFYDWLYKHNLPPGFRVLCSNCNHGTFRNKGICPHKTKALAATN